MCSEAVQHAVVLMAVGVDEVKGRVSHRAKSIHCCLLSLLATKAAYVAPQLVMFTPVASAEGSEPSRIHLCAAMLAGAVSRTRPTEMKVRAPLSSTNVLTTRGDEESMVGISVCPRVYRIHGIG